MLKTALKPKWIAALAFALIVAAAFALLGQWQFSRSLQKDVAPPSVTEQVKPLGGVMSPGETMLGTMEGQLVSVEGQFDAGRQVLVPARVQDGEEGYWVVTALAINGAQAPAGVAATDQVVIPVARGWVPAPENIPAAPAGVVSLEGRLLNSEGPELNRELPAGQVQTLSSAELTNVWDVSTYAAFIVSFSETIDGQAVGAGVQDGGLTPITVTATDQNNKINWLNIFYSIEWVLFAGFAVFLWWRLVTDDHRREQDALFDIDDDDDGNDDDNDDDVAAAPAAVPTAHPINTIPINRGEPAP